MARSEAETASILAGHPAWPERDSITLHAIVDGAAACAEVAVRADEGTQSFEDLWGRDPYLCTACGRVLGLPPIEQRAALPVATNESRPASTWAVILGGASAFLLLVRFAIAFAR